jgi:hypothetical protein
MKSKPGARQQVREILTTLEGKGLFKAPDKPRRRRRQARLEPDFVELFWRACEQIAHYIKDEMTALYTRIYGPVPPFKINFKELLTREIRI